MPPPESRLKRPLSLRAIPRERDACENHPLSTNLSGLLRDAHVEERALGLGDGLVDLVVGEAAEVCGLGGLGGERGHGRGAAKGSSSRGEGCCAPGGGREGCGAHGVARERAEERGGRRGIHSRKKRRRERKEVGGEEEEKRSPLFHSSSPRAKKDRDATKRNERLALLSRRGVGSHPRRPSSGLPPHPTLPRRGVAGSESESSSGECEQQQCRRRRGEEREEKRSMAADIKNVGAC